MYLIHTIGAPDSVLSVTIDPLTVSINRTNNIVNFTLEWDEPFDNFDLILNYTVIITCTNVTGCPVTFTTNITRLDVSLMTNLAMMNHSIAITANNSIGGSDPTTRFIICKCQYFYIYRIQQNFRVGKLLQFFSRSGKFSP